MCSCARHNKKLTDEKIFTAGIVEEGILLAAEESFKRVLQDKGTGGRGSNTDPGYGDEAYLSDMSSGDPTPSLQEEHPEQALKRGIALPHLSSPGTPKVHSDP